MRELNEQELELVTGGVAIAGAGGAASVLLGAASSDSVTSAVDTPFLAASFANNNSAAYGVGVGVISAAGSFANVP